MVIFNTPSKRARAAQGNPDVYQYDLLPSRLRVQISNLIQANLGDSDDYNSREVCEKFYSFIVKAVRHELGVDVLTPRIDPNYFCDDIAEFIRRGSSPVVLDAIEIVFKMIGTLVAGSSYMNRNNTQSIYDNSVSELNTRFLEHGVGYQFVSNELIRIDSTFLHTESVKPALMLLTDSRFANADSEFKQAHKHYREGNYKDCIVNCGKSFESTMKIICSIREWTYSPDDTASKLVQICLSNGLIETSWQTNFTSLSSLLQTAVPTQRNKVAAHGAGPDLKDTPDYLASYIVHVTASTIILLIEAFKTLPIKATSQT